MRRVLSVTIAALLLLTGFWTGGISASVAPSGSDCFSTYKSNNHRDGIYGGTQINAPALIQTWEYKGQANLTNAPAVCGNRIYLAENSRKVTCIEYLTGKVLWQQEDLANFPVSTPSIYLGDQNQFVYVSTGGQIERESVLYCFDANTGNIMWEWRPNRDGTIGQICTGPTIVTVDDGLDDGQVWLIVGVNVSGGTALFALDHKTGIKMWGGSGIGLNDIAKADPVIAEEKIFHVTTDGVLHIIELTTGRRIAEPVLDDENIYEFNNTPAYSNGLLFLASKAKVNTDEKGKLYAVETSTGMLKKETFGIDQFNRVGPTVFKPPFSDKLTVMIGSDTGRIYKFDGTTLTMMYSVDLKRPITTDVVISGKYGFFGAANNFYSMELEKGNTVFSQTLGNTITMHPVPTAGMVYVACNDSRLYAFSDHDDFVLDVLPRSDAIYSGNKRSYKVLITGTMDFDSPMILRTSGLPNTLKASFSKPFVYPGLDEQEVELIIEASEDAQPGNYICNVIGVLLGRERSTILQIQILPPLLGDFKLSVSQEQLLPVREIEAGDSISFQIKVEAIGGFNAEVAFFVNPDTIPTSIDVMFLPDRLTPDGYVTAIVSTDTSTEGDKYNIEIQGHAGGKVRTTGVYFNIGGFDTDDWTMFQHDPNRTGKVNEPFPTNPELRWSIDVAKLFGIDADIRIRTQSIIALGTCYVVGEWESEEDTRTHESALFAVDSKTGAYKWMYKFDKSIRVDDFDDAQDVLKPVMSTPAVDVEAKKIYVGSIDGRFYCLDATSGSRIWSRRTDPTVPIRSAVLLLTPENSEITSKRVLFSTQTGQVYCMSGDENDKKIWQRDLPSHVIGGLSYAFNDARNKSTILVPCHDGNVYSLDLTDGSDVWQTSVFQNRSIGTIAVDQKKREWWLAGVMGSEYECWGNSQIVKRNISDGSGSLFRATFGPNFGSPALVINPTSKTVCHANVNFGINERIKTRTNRLFRLENDSLVSLLGDDGEYIDNWVCNRDDPALSRVNYSSVIVDNTASSVVPTRDGTLFGFDVNGKQLFELETGHETKAHPTMARRMMYLPTEDGFLYAWAQKWGFGLAPETGSPVICQGQPISLNIHFRSEIPLPRGVKFKVLQAPPDTVTNFTPETLGASGTTSLYINVGNGCPEGTHSITIQAEGSGFRRSTTFTIVVRKEAQGDFVFTADPTRVEIYAGEPAEFDFTIDAAGGFIGVVQLSVEGVPTGAVGAFSPIITTVPGKSKYKINVAKTVPPGTYNLTFRAEGGCKTKTYPVTLVVEPPVPGDYKASLVTSEDKDVILWLGESREISVQVDFLEGYNIPVQLKVLNKDDFPGVDFDFIPNDTVTESGIVNLKMSTEFLGQTVDGKRVIIQTTSGRKAPKNQVSFFLTVKKTEGGFSIKPVGGSSVQLSAGQMGTLVFEYNNTSRFLTTTKFELVFDGCDGFPYSFSPERLSPSIHPQNVVCTFMVPPTFLDNDPEAKAKGFKECNVQCFGIGGGLRIGSRSVLLRIYDSITTNQRAYFYPEFKGLKNKSTDSVEIQMANLDNVCAVEFDIVYDPLKIDIVEVTEGQVMTSDLKKASFVVSDDPSLGICRVSSIREEGAGPISGSGLFANVLVRGKTISQETSIRIANLKVLDCFNTYKPILSAKPNEPPICRFTIAGNLPGDVNGDGKVDTEDLLLLSKTFGLSAGDPGFDGRADFNEDG